MCAFILSDALRVKFNHFLMRSGSASQASAQSGWHGMAWHGMAWQGIGFGDGRGPLPSQHVAKLSLRRKKNDNWRSNRRCSSGRLKRRSRAQRTESNPAHCFAQWVVASQRERLPPQGHPPFALRQPPGTHTDRLRTNPPSALESGHGYAFCCALGWLIAVAHGLRQRAAFV